MAIMEGSIGRNTNMFKLQMKLFVMLAILALCCQSCAHNNKDRYTEYSESQDQLDKLIIQQESSGGYLYQLYFTSSYTSIFDNVLIRSRMGSGVPDTLYVSNMIYDFTVDNEIVTIRMCYDEPSDFVSGEKVRITVDSNLDCTSRTDRVIR